MKLIKLAKFFAVSRKIQVGQKLRLRQDCLKRIGLIAKKLDKVKLKLFVPRKVEPRSIYSNSTWGQMIINPRGEPHDHCTRPLYGKNRKRSNFFNF